MVCGDQRKGLPVPVLVFQIPSFKIGSSCIAEKTHDFITPNSVFPEFGDFIWGNDGAYGLAPPLFVGDNDLLHVGMSASNRHNSKSNLLIKAPSSAAARI